MTCIHVNLKVKLRASTSVLRRVLLVVCLKLTFFNVKQNGVLPEKTLVRTSSPPSRGTARLCASCPLQNASVFRAVSRKVYAESEGAL